MAVSQAAKRFEQKIEVNHEIKEVMQKMIKALKELWMSNVETWLLYFYFKGDLFRGVKLLITKAKEEIEREKIIGNLKNYYSN